LLNHLLSDPYFSLAYPKSTGREYFHLDWLEKFLSPTMKPVDIQTTLVELTAVTLLHAIQCHFTQGEMYICGGGVHNSFLMSRIRALATHYTVESTQKFDVNPDWVEAMAFAWLAQQTLQKKFGNIVTVTGARHPAILGGVYYC
jgi:anhydro-N-acetylmuramic acid kinase